MDYVNLGKTGLKVSRLCLGCMTYGAPDRGAHPWTLDEGQSRPFIQRAIELGVNFFDTSNSYSDGTSEEILGRAIRDFARRGRVLAPLALEGGKPLREAVHLEVVATHRRGCERRSHEAADLRVQHVLLRLGVDQQVPLEEVQCRIEAFARVTGRRVVGVAECAQ